MVATGELRKLKSELVSFESLNLEDLKFYTQKINRQINKIKKEIIIPDEFYRNYIDKLIINHIRLIEDYVNGLKEEDQEKTEFAGKALRYHFNCIIDSYTYALIAIQYN